ncbi:MAG: hypothetical protein HKN85_07260, partial [Gammaproteobacteria bacterium]|nr:hypothetical protein [Gammaproteobacteria bacterium]
CALFFISSLALAYVYAKRAEVTSVVGGGSVIEQTGNGNSVDSEIPGIDSVPSSDDGVPVIGGDDGLPTIESSVPEALQSVDGAQQAAGDAIDDAVEAIEQETPAIPQQ